MGDGLAGLGRGMVGALSPQRRRAVLAFAALVFVIAQVSAVRAETILYADRDWSEAEGWKVYWNAQNEGCFAEQTQASGTQVLFGMLGKDNRLAIGFRNDALGFAKKDKSYQLKLRFDGRASLTSGMTLYDFGGGPLLLGNYGSAAKFRADIAKAAKLTIHLGKKSLAAITLKGSSAAFKAVDDCRKEKGGQTDAPVVAVKADAKVLAEADKLNNEAILANCSRWSSIKIYFC